jgi:hypothetical protein
MVSVLRCNTRKSHLKIHDKSHKKHLIDHQVFFILGVNLSSYVLKNTSNYYPIIKYYVDRINEKCWRYLPKILNSKLKIYKKHSGSFLITLKLSINPLVILLNTS